MKKGKNPTQGERLARVETLCEKIDKALENHLSHHWAVTVALLGAMLTQTAVLVVGLIKLIK